MLRFALLLFLVLAVLFLLRALRVLTTALFPRSGQGAPPEITEGEMVRDPVCGTWIDRRLALAARTGDGWVPVCSERCRQKVAQPVEEPPVQTRAGDGKT